MSRWRNLSPLLLTSQSPAVHGKYTFCEFVEMYDLNLSHVFFCSESQCKQRNVRTRSLRKMSTHTLGESKIAARTRIDANRGQYNFRENRFAENTFHVATMCKQFAQRQQRIRNLCTQKYQIIHNTTRLRQNSSRRMRQANREHHYLNNKQKF